MFDSEFNPKGPSLLDEQLAVSGLEMTWLPAVIAGVGAIASGVMGSNSARDANKRNTKNAEAQEAHNKLVAEKTNEYNADVHEADQANYHAMRDYSFDMSIQIGNVALKFKTINI